MGSEAHRDAVGAQADSTDILLELQSLNQALAREISPLVKKHDDCLYGSDGRGGIVSIVGFLQKAGYVLLTIISAVSIVDVIRFFKGK